MKTNQHTAEQIIKILEQAERGEQSVGAICREHGIGEATFYRWRAYGGMAVNEAQRLKELEKENTRLKRLLAERMLEVDALKELLAKKGLSIAELCLRGALLGRQRLVGAAGPPARSAPACHLPLPGPPCR